MSKFTITVDDAQIEKFILNMLSLLQNNPGIDFKKDGNNFVITTTGDQDNFMLAGKPMTWEELLQDIAESEKQYEEGDYFTSDQIKRESKNW